MFSRTLFALLVALGATPACGQEAELGCQNKVPVEQVIQDLNAFRAQPRSCGSQDFGPAGPLRWEGRLAQAAQSHATELAQGEQLNHRSTNGRTLRERLRASGYLAYRVGENLAAGQESLDEVLQTWIVSTKHCENIMQADFRDVALACASGPGKYGNYWVLNLGRSISE
ncbi:CAP domain-containing protein [Paucibacter sp. TC2R-5]|uniref:CAP domain-containing protein n=1 Tax=Paucibacter sp. TC2R-5 TaxID=2893555 RepID=UPI0021E4037C|nr:CAP domain-containing protein [Paucibacter sp. TC2R-5]MCV2360712.1 CAP domain-containing protein [Paucibacter sp. TC2R-5]